MLIAEFSHKGEEIEIENELWQYDYGQRIQIKGLDLPETFEVHFAWKDSEKAKVVIGSTVNGISTVDIPNVALEQRRTITAYIYLSGITEGETVNTIILSVNKRKAPENFGTPEDVDLFHHTLAATAEYQRQAKESEKQAAARSADAEAWAHGREDHPDQEQDNAKYYAEQAAASQQAAELLQQRVSDLATQAQNNIGEAQQQAIKTITEQQGISIQKIKNQTAESEDNLKNTIRAAEQIKTDLDTEVENATPIKQGLDDSNTAAIKTKVDLENEISEGIQTKIDIQTTAEKAMSNLQAEATKQQEFIKTSIDDTLSISGKAADAAVTGKKIDSLKEEKVDYSQNLASASKLKGENTFKANVTINDDGSITVVPTVNYGRYDFSYPIPNEGKKKIFYFSATVTGENIPSISTAAYCYNDYTNLKELKKIATQTITNRTDCNISQIWEYIDTQYNTNKIDIGIMTNTGVEYTITRKSMLLIDITELAESANPDELLTKCKILYGTDYWEKIVESELAKTAESAE